MPGKPFSRDDPRINRNGRPPSPSLTAEIMAALGPEGRELAARMLARIVTSAEWTPPNRGVTKLDFEQWWAVVQRFVPAAAPLKPQEEGAHPSTAIELARALGLWGPGPAAPTE